MRRVYRWSLLLSLHLTMPTLASAGVTTPTVVTSPGSARALLAKNAKTKKTPPPPADAPTPGRGTTTKIKFGRFGTVTVYQPPTAPVHAAIFLSGDGGWNSGVVDMAKMLVAKEYLVIGVDVPRYQATAGMTKQRCVYPPGDLQALSQYVQKRLGIRRYLVPALVGYSSGATLAYAALAEAPTGTFGGAVSLGFCSDIEIKKPLCKGEGLEFTPLMGKKGLKGYDLKPFKLNSPWFALHGKSDQVCDLAKSEAFVAQTGPSGKFVALDRVGHGFGVQKRWQTQFEQAMRDIAAASFAPKTAASSATTASATPSSAQDLNAPPSDAGNVPLNSLDLPLIEVPADPDVTAAPVMAVIISGDGGWAGLDREVAGSLAENGVPVLGLDSLQYFWSQRTPESAASDLARAITFYLNHWSKARFIAIGYSFGADVLPFMLSRLPPELKARLASAVLISPSPKASFEFKVGDWFGGEDDDTPTLPVGPEVAKLGATPLLCFYGTEDHTALCPSLKNQAKVVALEGSHRLADSWDELTATILTQIGLKGSPKP